MYHTSFKEAVAWRCSVKNVLLKLRQIDMYLPVNLCETATQVFSGEFYEIFKKMFIIEPLRWLLLHLKHVAYAFTSPSSEPIYVNLGILFAVNFCGVSNFSESKIEISINFDFFR